MTDLRKAAEMALEALEGALSDDQPYIRKSEKAVEALRQALAQPVDAVNMSQERVDEMAKCEHEPVAWQVMVGNEALKEFPIEDMAHDWCVKQKLNGSSSAYWIRPLYTAPPKREWVGLTDDEIYDYADKFLYQHGSNYGIRSFGKAIEAKLKEKNA